MNHEFLFAKNGAEIMTKELNGDDGEQQEESGREIDITPEMELALGRVLLPVFADYLQEMGFLEASEQRKTAKQDRDDEMTIEETVNKIAGAQLGHAFRLSRIEDGFRQIAAAIQQLAKIVSATDEQLESDIAALDGRFERIDAIIERAAELQRENAVQIKALIEAQARTDEQIRFLLDGKGSTARKAVKKVVKKESVK
jgi:hypothetical protein